MPRKGRRTSIWIPEELDDLLKKNPVVINRVCRAALKKACQPDSDQDTPADTAAITTELSKVEEKNRTMTKALEGIARRAAKQADMVVLTEKEAELFKEVLDTSLEQFVLKIRREAVEEYIKDRTRKKEMLSKSKSKAAQIESVEVETTIETSSQPHQSSIGADRIEELSQQVVADPTSTCVCGDKADTVCSGCGRPLCWICWTGHDNDEEDAVTLCPQCQRLDDGTE